MNWKTEADTIKELKPKHILFLCVANSARSQMAEGIARKLAPKDTKISSAGSSPSKVNPLAVKALSEIEIDISSHFSKSVETINPQGVDVVITLCAEEVCPIFLGNAKRFHWGLPDPTSEIESFRNVRDELYLRLNYLFGNKNDKNKPCSCCRPRKHQFKKQLSLLGISFILWIIFYFNLVPISKFITYSLLSLRRGSALGKSVEFFFFDIPKVLMLLVLIVFFVGIIRSFFTPERTRKILAGKKESVGNILAALLGIVTPFCSCSAVPLFIGFVSAGVPLGVTFSFLISAPMVNEIALALLYGMFGWKVALLYLLTGLLIAIVSGWIIGRLKMEAYIEDWVKKTKAPISADNQKTEKWSERIDDGLQAVKDIVGKVWPYVIMGIAVGAGIHGYVPEDFMISIMGKGAWWSVPLAVIIGVPLYSNAAGIIPIVHALLEKGAALGTVLAFMMAVIGLSLPETIILRKVLKPRLIAVFIGVVATGILIIGYGFNIIF